MKYAKEGDACAQLTVGTLLYYGGNGIEKNTTEGIQWLKKAAAQGEKEAQKLLDKIL